MTMAWYSLINNRWMPRLAPPTQTVRANTDPAVEDKEGEEVEGKFLTRISWDDALAENKRDIYLVPKKRKTWNDELIEAKLADDDTFLHIWVYCPNLNKLPKEEPRDRIIRFGEAVSAAARYTPDIFLGPEYFFTRNSDQLDSPQLRLAHCYNAEERDLVERAVRGAGFNHRGMLIIPGTMLWKDDSRNVQNTAFIHCRSFGLFLVHSKHHSHHDDSYANAEGCTFKPGGTTCVDFEFRGFTARYQICADMGMDKKEMKDLHLLSGFAIGGGVEPRAHGGGWEVLSDGAGGGGRIDKPLPAGKMVEMNHPKDSDSFSLVVHIRKLAK